MAVRLAPVVAVAVALLHTRLVSGSMDYPRQVYLGENEIELVCTWDDDVFDDVPGPPFAPKVYWYFNNDTILDNTPKYKIMQNPKRSTLTIYNIGRLDQGNYTCMVGQHGSTYILDLKLPPEMRIEPAKPFIGNKTHIICSMRGKPQATIAWLFEPLNRSPMKPYQYTAAFDRTQVHTESNKTGSFLIIRLYPTLMQAGNYKCISERLQTDINLSLRGISLSCNHGVVKVAMEDDVTFNCHVENLPMGYKRKEIVWKKKSPQGEYNIVDSLSPKFQTYEYEEGWKTKAVLLVRDVHDKDFDWTFYLKVTVYFESGEKPWEAFASMRMERARNCTTCFADELSCDARQHCVCPPRYVRNMDFRATNLVCIDEEEEEDGRSGGGPDNDRQGGDKKVVVVNHTSVATIIGVTLGALAMILAVIVAYICWRKRRKARKNESRFDPNYLYQYEYHGEANTHTFNPTFINHGYQLPPPKLPVRKENTYISTIEKERLEFPRDKLQLGVDLGEGRFGKVIQGRADNITGSGTWVKVAVKTCRPTATDFEKQDLYQELEIMRKIPAHPNVVALYGCCSKTDPLYIIMEYVQRGSMLDYLRKCRPMSRISRDSRDSAISSATMSSSGTVSSGGTMMSDLSLRSQPTTLTSSFMQPRAKDLTIFALQIARGMAHVASCGIIHRDLAARNILLGTDFSCKICDFGLARDVEGVDVYERTSKGPLPIRWMSPESLHENLYTKKSDVWSYGILLLEIVTLGATPYQGKAANEVMRQVLQGTHLPQPLHCREEMYDLMLKCWEKPDLRPTFSDIVNHFEALMDDDYIILSEYDESDYQWLDSYTMEERV